MCDVRTENNDLASQGKKQHQHIAQPTQTSSHTAVVRSLARSLARRNLFKPKYANVVDFILFLGTMVSVRGFEAAELISFPIRITNNALNSRIFSIVFGWFLMWPNLESGIVVWANATKKNQKRSAAQRTQNRFRSTWKSVIGIINITAQQRSTYYPPNEKGHHLSRECFAWLCWVLLLQTYHHRRHHREYHRVDGIAWEIHQEL